jgi:anti-sigma regulatory factor (Ser/Thr protein kinase)
MSLSIENRLVVLNSILKEIQKNNTSVVLTISQNFGISKQTVYRYIVNLVNEGHILVNKKGRRNFYSLNKTKKTFTFNILGLEEDIVWRDTILPLIKDLSPNVLNACNYGFTEMLNNAIDHSDAEKVIVGVTETVLSIEFMIIDFGIGIFTKIQKALDLEDPKHSILELAKGKLTTDPTKHSGEGIFFTSRIFDEFYIRSCELQFFSGRNNHRDYLYEDLDKNENKGTCVIMEINKDSNVIIRDVFDAFTAQDDDSFGFSKTHIPVRLAKHEGEMLVSRSQAKRLIRRFDHFMEVVLDFTDVTEIGQAFADELFRVFSIDHPDVELIPTNMSEEVKKMVTRALSNRSAN